MHLSETDYNKLKELKEIRRNLINSGASQRLIKENSKQLEAVRDSSFFN